MGVTEHFLQKSQIFNIYETSRDDSKDIIRIHCYGYFAFLANNVVFWTKLILSIKTTDLLQKQQ